MKRKNFTLTEMIVVIAIIAILVAVIAPNAFKSIEKAKVSEAVGDFRAYNTAIYSFYADIGDWPKGWGRDGFYACAGSSAWDNGLVTNYDNWSGWKGPYLEKMKGRNPWGGAYCLEYYDVDHNGSREYFLEFNTSCYPHGGGKSCPAPMDSTRKLDKALDDGDLSTGDIRRGSSFCGDSACVEWTFVWDTGL